MKYFRKPVSPVYTYNIHMNLQTKSTDVCQTMYIYFKMKELVPLFESVRLGVN